MANSKVMASLTAERPLAATNTSSDALLDRLTGLHPKLIDLSLGRIERLLERLDHPERDLPPVVHVAGTNGKGSVIAYLAAMLRAEARAVHSYISPHLVRFHERIRLDGQPIAEPDLVRLLQVCEAANGEAPITFFEITTAAALLAFSRVPADVLLLETGLGGRLDATNVVARPRLTVITPLSLDHTQYLGETLEEIAFEKAGILKPGVPAVVAPQTPQAFQVIERRAEEVGASLICGGRDWSVAPEGDGFRFHGTAGCSRFPLPRLAGPHQVDNAGLALAAAEALGDLRPSESSLRRGLLEVDWPGRLQRLSRGPLVDLVERADAAGRWELWLDGGHNGAAGEALSRALADWQDRPLHLVFGMMSSKAVQDFLAPLAPLAETLRAVSIPGEHATLSADEAADKAREAGLEAEASSDVTAALGSILDGSDRPGRVLICGSLYLAGSVLSENG
jgi:dihydrofolate synthase/folylpolyglutamate synthase